VGYALAIMAAALLEGAEFVGSDLSTKHDLL
jgi:hypothetical protein